MQKFHAASDQIVFVCYRAGTGGERLSVDISQLPGFRPLQYYTTGNKRTVITNEIFQKTFLNPHGPFDKLLVLAEALLHLPDNQDIVVPSHWDVPYLLPFFSQAKFIRILSPDSHTVAQLAHTKVLQDPIASFEEFLGFCRIWLEPAQLSQCLRTNKLNHRMTAGEILKVIREVVQTQDQCQDLFLEELAMPNVLNIAYGGFEINQQKILDFLHVDHGSINNHV